jgi:hypothetical protein
MRSELATRRTLILLVALIGAIAGTIAGIFPRMADVSFGIAFLVGLALVVTIGERTLQSGDCSKRRTEKQA